MYKPVALPVDSQQSFFQSCWDIIDKDIYSVVYEFFNIGLLPTNLNSNLLFLIPRVEGPSTIDKFWPIVLSNFLFKIVTKILVDRLAIIAGKIVSFN